MHVTKILPRSARLSRRNKHFLPYCGLTVCLWAASSIAPAVESNQPTNYPVSVSAQKRVVSVDTGDLLSTSHIQFGPGGLRAVDTRTDGEAEYLENYESNQIWLINRRRAVFTEVPLIRNQQPATEKTVIDLSGDEDATQSSLFSVKPCPVGHAQFQQETRWRGHDVGLWHCIGRDGHWLSRQWFSHAYGFVIREEKRHRQIHELTNIKMMEFAEGHFVPRKQYRKVDIHTFITGSDSLSRYQEPEV